MNVLFINLKKLTLMNSRASTFDCLPGLHNSKFCPIYWSNKHTIFIVIKTIFETVPSSLEHRLPHNFQGAPTILRNLSPPMMTMMMLCWSSWTQETNPTDRGGGFCFLRLRFTTWFDGCWFSMVVISSSVWFKEKAKHTHHTPYERVTGTALLKGLIIHVFSIHANEEKTIK